MYSTLLFWSRNWKDRASPDLATSKSWRCFRRARGIVPAAQSWVIGECPALTPDEQVRRQLHKGTLQCPPGVLRLQILCLPLGMSCASDHPATRRGSPFYRRYCRIVLGITGGSCPPPAYQHGRLVRVIGCAGPKRLTRVRADSRESAFGGAA